MGRLKGSVLSEEQKEKMRIGRENKKLGIVVGKPVKIKSDRKCGRPKGYKRDPETIRKQKETKLNNKLGIKKEKVYEKPLLKISKHWKEGFDFWEAIRNVMRPLHRYDECRKVERLIVTKDIWQDREAILKILQEYFICEAKKLKVNV
jgi:hypothetical protein